MEQKQIANIFKSLGGEERLKLVLFLSSGEKCVCKIFEHLKIPQNLASYHLSALRKASLVTSRKEGTWVYYSLNKKSFKELQTFLKKII